MRRRFVHSMCSPPGRFAGKPLAVVLDAEDPNPSAHRPNPMVAVGTAIADRPPHRSRRALLTHAPQLVLNHSESPGKRMPSANLTKSSDR
jgi:hypothetical protein